MMRVCYHQSGLHWACRVHWACPNVEGWFEWC